MIKYLLQLEYYGGPAQRKGAFSNSLTIAPAKTVTRRAIKMPRKLSHSVTAWSNYIPLFLTVMERFGGDASCLLPVGVCIDV